MSRETWSRPQDTTHQGRDETKVQLVETIDRETPETKAALADAVGISEQYLSELLRELKDDGVVTKGYVVDEDALHDNVGSVSQLASGTRDTLAEERSDDLLALLGALDDVTREQYSAARQQFNGEEPTEAPEQLEGLANERHRAVFDELKSYTLATEWPGNRVASDLATIATNFEIVGDRACFVADAIDAQSEATVGVVEERIDDIFAAGERINDCLADVLFDADLDRYEDLRREEETVHRDLDELFELVTAYDPTLYGHLVTVTRALERAIFYWVHSAEIAVRLHSGIRPEHISM